MLCTINDVWMDTPTFKTPVGPMTFPSQGWVEELRKKTSNQPAAWYVRSLAPTRAQARTRTRRQARACEYMYMFMFMHMYMWLRVRAGVRVLVCVCGCVRVCAHAFDILFYLKFSFSSFPPRQPYFADMCTHSRTTHAYFKPAPQTPKGRKTKDGLMHGETVSETHKQHPASIYLYAQ